MKEKEDLKSPATVVSAAKGAGAVTASVQKPTSEGSDTESDCVRGPAEPVVDKKVFPNSAFRLNEDKFTGTETVNLPTGDRLLIRNGGCEAYMLTFEFETSRFKGDTSDAYLWAGNSVKLMKEAQKGIKAPIAISAGTRTLENLLQKTVRFEFGEEVPFEEGEIPSMLTLNRVKQLPNKKYLVSLTYYTGPL